MDRLIELLKLTSVNASNLSNLSTTISGNYGWLFGALGTVAISLYGLSVGRTRAVMSLLAIYVAFVFDRTFPFLEKIGQITGNLIELYWLRAGIFIFAYIAIYVIFNLSFIKRRLSSTEFSLVGVIFMSLFQLGFIVSTILSFLPEPVARELSFGFYVYIGTKEALFLWAVAPILAILFLKER